MIYVYIAMASREGILLLNGSSIRSWWIWHHYLAAFTCIIFLMMPVDSPAVQRYVEGWLHWTVAQAVLMLAQNRCAPARMLHGACHERQVLEVGLLGCVCGCEAALSTRHTLP